MCVVSMVMDHFHDKWKLPIVPLQWPYWVQPNPYTGQPQLTEEEIKELRKLLDRAKKYDEETGQKDCELEEKKKRLRELAEELGAKVEFLE